MLALVVFAVTTGCNGCESEVLDRLEMRLKDDPTRSGKVGTLRGLEVAGTARQIAEADQCPGERDCNSSIDNSDTGR